MAEKSIRKNAAFNVMKTAMSMLFPLITFPYASRILSPEGIGKVNFANSIVAYFTLIAGLGIEFYGIREGARVRHDKDKLSKLTMELFLLNLISTVISYGLFAISLIFFHLGVIVSFFACRLLQVKSCWAAEILLAAALYLVLKEEQYEYKKIPEVTAYVSGQ